MTTVETPAPARHREALPQLPALPHRTELDLALQQLAAVDRFNADRRQREAALEATAQTRETRLDSARSRDALRRQHAALVERAHAHLLATGEQLGRQSRRRVVLAHRNAWFLDRVQTVLQDDGLDVVALTDNGADAVGLVVAEQPDLVLLEDALLMVPGEEVVRQARHYAPLALVAVQTASDAAVARLLEAGATAVFTRQVPPRDVAHALLDLVRG
ncbi:MAG: DNA-binding response regulator [Frankiales bacterium]|nr:DNA-binding response regulator [Frankiales bacterium]